jgi:hypothetical protein
MKENSLLTRVSSMNTIERKRRRRREKKERNRKTLPLSLSLSFFNGIHPRS